MNNFSEKVSFIWSVADLLRGPYRPNQYKDVMLPLTVLRRLDCVLEPTKDAVLAELKKHEGGKVKDLGLLLLRKTGLPFYNTSRYSFERLRGDSANIAANLVNYIKGFSPRARDIIEQFGFEEHIAKLDKTDRLYLVVSKFCDIDLSPDVVSNIEMGYIFEELIRKFNEASNEEAGDHFTPREVIRLMVDLLYLPDDNALTVKGVVKTLYDPACGTGGMLSVAEEYVRNLNPDARLEVFGQDYNAQAYAICGADMMIKGQDIDHIAFGDSFTDDRFYGHRFDYMLANPPFGVEWKPEADAITREHEEQGFGGRFGAGLPRINDGSLLFLQHMISKMKDPKDGGSRLGIVFNGSPLFSGGTGSGESEIRRWIIENDWLEAIVALPNQLFYNTEIYTCLWILTNRKEKDRKGKIQLVDGTPFFKKMRKSLGKKRNEICDDQRKEIVQLYGDFLNPGEHVRVFNNTDFGYRRITVERPLRLNFAANEYRIARLAGCPSFTRLATARKRKDRQAAHAEVAQGLHLQEKIIAALRNLASKGVVRNREEFAGMVKDSFEAASLRVSSAVFEDILMSLSERDEKAEACLDEKGNPEPDPELRDYENVPLKADIGEYVKNEVLPFVPDAWVDHLKTKIGYEIPLTRYFFRYRSHAQTSQIEDSIRQAIGRLYSMTRGEMR